jgi:hypothetical protein
MTSVVRESASVKYSGAVPSQLSAGPFWGSFESFRTQGANALLQMEDATVGTLMVKGRAFRVLRDEDFQSLVGLAREVERIRRGLRVVTAAVKTVQAHKDPVSIETLVEATLLLGESPSLPAREEFTTLRPESGEDVGDDEVELDPAVVRSVVVGAGV